MSKPAGLFWGAAALLAALFIAYFNYFPVGFFGDDAMYLLGAKSLLHGRFEYLFMPQQTPNNIVFPGYSAFLACFMTFLGSHWPAYKVLSVIVTLAACILGARLFEKSSWSMSALVILIGCSPIIALYSGTVMSDPLYIFCVVSVFLFARKVYQEPESTRNALSLGLLLGASVMVRTPGVCLILAVIAGLMYQRRWKTALRAASVSVSILAAGLLRNYWITHTSTNYVSQWALNHPSQDPLFAIRSLGHLLQNLFAEDIAGLFDYSHSWGAVGVKGFLVILGLVLVARGLVGMERRYALHGGFTLSMALFLMLHVLMHSLWISSDYRFLLPVIPCVIGLAYWGVQDIVPSTKMRWCIFASVLILYARWHGVILHKQWASEHNPNALPWASYQWITQHTGPDTVIASAKPATVYLYTGRPGMIPPSIRQDERLFHDWLIKQSVSYVFCRDEYRVVPARAKIWEQQLAWLMQDPKSYSLIFTNLTDRVAIFKVNGTQL